MADHIVTPTQQGAWEIHVEAGTITTVLVQAQKRANASLQITAHDGDAPVYVRPGAIVAVAQPEASMIPQGTWMTLWFDANTDVTLALTSAADATVSVGRS